MALATRQGLLAPDASHSVTAENRKGPSKDGRHADLALSLLLLGHALTSPSATRWSNWPGRHLICPDAREGARPLVNCPGDAGGFATRFYGATRTVGVLGRSTADVLSARS